MNYILILHSYGKKSMELVVNSMSEPCEILAKKKDGTWWHYLENADSPDEHGKAWERRRPSEIMEILRDDSNRIINWGNRIFSSDEYFKVNVPSAISKASDKKESRGILMSKGIRIPPTNLFGGVFMVSPKDFPLILRPRFHYGGKEFHVLNSFAEFEPFMWGKDWNNWYASKIFPKTHEFRVHCAHGKVLLINEKPLVEGEIRANHVVNQEIWRALKWSEFHPGICEESLKATQALGLDYAAVDIMYNAQNDSVAICELNTSPGITTEYTSGKYAAYFSWLIRHDFPAHFPIDGKSVFYNKILES